MTRVREARVSDLPRLEAVRAASLPESAPALLDLAVRGTGLVLVSTDPFAPGEVVGYALAMRDGEREVAYLAELAVAPGYRRRGRGSALLSAIVDRLDDHEELRLTTRADDDRARSFYESHGFVVRERLADHYESGDGVLYGRPL